MNRKSPHLLVVDDDIKILRFLSYSLAAAGYEVTTVTGGEEALKLAESVKPDIMLLDILMSPMNGLEVLRRLRTTSELPVIAISAQISAAGGGGGELRDKQHLAFEFLSMRIKVHNFLILPAWLLVSLSPLRFPRHKVFFL
jgi:CheY-like chemotaxis protein